MEAVANLLTASSTGELVVVPERVVEPTVPEEVDVPEPPTEFAYLLACAQAGRDRWTLHRAGGCWRGQRMRFGEHSLHSARPAP